VEPNIGPDATGALFAPSAGVVIPFEFTIALAENAAMNGVDFKCSREVTAIDPKTNEEDEGGNGGENGSGKYVVKASYYPSAVAQAQQRQRGAWLAKLWSLKGSAIVAVIASVGVVVWQTTASASVAIGVIVAALMFYGEMFLAESPKGKLVKGKVRGGWSVRDSSSCFVRLLLVNRCYEVYLIESFWFCERETSLRAFVVKHFCSAQRTHPPLLLTER